MNKKLALSLAATLLATLISEELEMNECCCKPKNCCSKKTPLDNNNELFRREPDGVKIAVDRPLQEQFHSRHDWAEAMANYRMLIDQAKKCDWESRNVDECSHVVYDKGRDWYDDNEPMHPSSFMEEMMKCHCHGPRKMNDNPYWIFRV